MDNKDSQANMNAVPEAGEFMKAYFSAPGISGIFNFPFRIYSSESLNPLEMINPETGFKYRITFIENNESSRRPTVPFKYWPNFESHPQVTKTENFEAPDLTYSAIEFGDRTYENIVHYNQLRLDIWATNLSMELLVDFCNRLMELTRLHTVQYWINAYEANFSLNNTVCAFPIDDQGRCLAFPVGEQKIIGHSFEPLDNDFLRQLVQRAILGDTVDEYWRVYSESANLYVKGYLDQAVLQLAISLEISRYVNLRPFMQIKKETAAGPTFAPPFNNTDLLVNLNDNLRGAIGRSLKDELPSVWKYVEQLYKARQQVAHGKKAAFPSEQGILINVDNKIFMNWFWAVRNANAWLISLKKSTN
jgi:hypothetical protein